ncbi:hypothetical protein Plhal304r1_c082g0167101 [Plasmopara halstedii]
MLASLGAAPSHWSYFDVYWITTELPQSWFCIDIRKMSICFQMLVSEHDGRTRDDTNTALKLFEGYLKELTYNELRKNFAFGDPVHVVFLRPKLTCRLRDESERV